MKTNTQDGKNLQVLNVSLKYTDSSPHEVVQLAEELRKFKSGRIDTETRHWLEGVSFHGPYKDGTQEVIFTVHADKARLPICLADGTKVEVACVPMNKYPQPEVEERSNRLLVLMERLKAEGLTPHGQAPEAQAAAEVTPPREEEAAQDAPAHAKAEKADRSEEKNMPPASASAPSPTPTPPTPSVSSSSSDTASFPADWIQVKETTFISAYIKALDVQGAWHGQASWGSVMRQCRHIFAKAGIPTYLCSAAPKKDTYEVQVLPFSVATDSGDKKRVPATIDPGAIDGQAKQRPYFSAWAYPPEESQIWCLDLDRHDKEDGEKALTQYLSEAVGEGAFAALMGKAWVDRTKRNGLHIFLQAPKEGDYDKTPKDGIELKQTNGIPLAGSSYFEGAQRKELYSNVNRGGVLTGGRIYDAILRFFKKAEAMKKICDAPALPAVLPSSNTPAFSELMKRVQANANKQIGRAIDILNTCAPHANHYPMLEAATILRKWLNFIPSSPYSYIDEDWFISCRAFREDGSRDDKDSKAIWRGVVEKGDNGKIEPHTIESQLAYIAQNDRPMPASTACSRKQQDWTAVPEEPDWVRTEFDAVPFEQGSWESATCYTTPPAPAPSTPSAPQSDRCAEAEKGPAAVEVNLPWYAKLPLGWVCGKDKTAGYAGIKWAVKGLIPRRGIGYLYAPSGAGKTFLALYFAKKIAYANEHPEQEVYAFNRRVFAGTHVFYLCFEGSEGLKGRLLALEQNYSWAREDGRSFWLCSDPQKYAIFDGRDTATKAPFFEFKNNLADHLPKGSLLIIDTLSQASPGADQNATADMSIISSECIKFANKMEGTVLLVAHTGKDVEKKLAGSKTQINNADFAIELKAGKHDGEKAVQLIAEKQKDAATARDIYFSFTSVPLDGIYGEDGEQEWSLALVERPDIEGFDEEGETAKPKKEKTPKEPTPKKETKGDARKKLITTLCIGLSQRDGGMVFALEEEVKRKFYEHLKEDGLDGASARTDAYKKATEGLRRGEVRGHGVFILAD